MRKLFSVFICAVVCISLMMTVYAHPPIDSEGSLEDFLTCDDADGNNSCPYSDGDINIIARIVNGEVGGICGDVTLTYADGTKLITDACTLHKIHARIVDNQVKSDMFPNSVYKCAKQCWSSSYANTNYSSSSQWQHCREDVLSVFSDNFSIPDNIFAATCDSRFAQKYSGFHLYARVDWDTGWVSGTYYYYSYGHVREYDEPKEDVSTIDYDYIIDRVKSIINKCNFSNLVNIGEY
jgi:hypothetical protein